MLDPEAFADITHWRIECYRSSEAFIKTGHGLREGPMRHRMGVAKTSGYGCASNVAGRLE
jgi:hypothetical protein